MKCWFCGGDVCWNADYNPDEVGYEENTEGVVAFLTCLNCGAEYQAAYIVENDSRNLKEDNEVHND